jgi:hypothetical protein
MPDTTTIEPTAPHVAAVVQPPGSQPPVQPPVLPPNPAWPHSTPATPAAPAKPKTAFTVVEPAETPSVPPPPAPVTPPTPAPGAVAAPAATGPVKEQIVSAGVLTIVMVTTTGTQAKGNMNAVILPKDAADLSVVEVHRAAESTGMDVAVYPNKGESIADLPVSDGTMNSKFAKGVSSAKPVSFRKMSKTNWAIIT